MKRSAHLFADEKQEQDPNRDVDINNEEEVDDDVDDDKGRESSTWEQVAAAEKLLLLGVSEKDARKKVFDRNLEELKERDRQNPGGLEAAKEKRRLYKEHPVSRLLDVGASATFMDMEALAKELSSLEMATRVSHVELQYKTPKHFAKKDTVYVEIAITASYYELLNHCQPSTSDTDNREKQVLVIPLNDHVLEQLEQKQQEHTGYDYSSVVVQECELLSAVNPYPTMLCVGSSLHEEAIRLPLQFEKSVMMNETAFYDEEEDTSNSSGYGYTKPVQQVVEEEEQGMEDEDEDEEDQELARERRLLDGIKLKNISISRNHVQIPGDRKIFSVLKPRSASGGQTATGAGEGDLPVVFRKARGPTEDLFLDVFGGHARKSNLQMGVQRASGGSSSTSSSSNEEQEYCYVPEKMALSMFIKCNVPQLPGGRIYQQFSDIASGGKVFKISLPLLERLSDHVDQHIFQRMPYVDLRQATLFLYPCQSLDSALESSNLTLEQLKQPQTMRFSLRIQFVCWKQPDASNSAACIFEAGEGKHFTERFYVKAGQGREVPVDQREVDSSVLHQLNAEYLKTIA